MDREKEKSRGIIESYCKELKSHWGTYEKIVPKEYRLGFYTPVLENVGEEEIRQWHDIMRHSITEGMSLSSLWKKGGWLFEEMNQPIYRLHARAKPVFSIEFPRRVIRKHKIPRNASADKDANGNNAIKPEVSTVDLDAAKTSSTQKRKAESGAEGQGCSASNKQPRLGQEANRERQLLVGQVTQQEMAASESQRKLNEATSKVSDHQQSKRRKQDQINGKQRDINDRRIEIERLEKEVHQLQESMREDEAKVVSHQLEVTHTTEECRLHRNVLQAMRELAKFHNENTQT